MLRVSAKNRQTPLRHQASLARLIASARAPAPYFDVGEGASWGNVWSSVFPSEGISMPAHIDERVIRSFRVDAEGLRDLHAIVRRRCDDIDPGLEIHYEVVRRDSLRYTTSNVEEIPSSAHTTWYAAIPRAAS